VTRILFTPNDMVARAYIKELMHGAGLAVRCAGSWLPGLAGLAGLARPNRIAA
jgi:hypothetical protein